MTTATTTEATAQDVIEQVGNTDALGAKPRRRRRKKAATKVDMNAAQTPLEKIAKFHSMCDTTLVDREEDIRLLTTGLVSGCSVFFVGVPGCLHADTPIYDPVDGTTATVYQRFLAAKPFHVYSWDEESGEVVITKADRPYEYEPADMIEFTFDNGETITVTHGHKFWTGSSYIEAVDVARLLESGHVHLPTIEDTCLSAQTSDVPHLNQRVAGSGADCQLDHHSCDEQLHSGEDIFQSSSPSQDDVPEHSQLSSHKDDQGQTHTHTPCQAGDPRSNSDYSRQTGPQTDCEWESYDPSEAVSASSHCTPSCETQSPYFQSHNTSVLQHPHAPVATADCLTEKLLSIEDDASSDTQPQIETAQEHLQSQPDSSRPDTSETFDQHQQQSHSSSLALDSPVAGFPESKNLTARRIVKATPVAGKQKYYDFCVPVTHNYWAVGSFHHNTAKSMMCDALCELIGSQKVFRKLMARNMDPAELFGPVSVESFKKEEFRRNTEGYLPTAEVAFLDEIWKCSPVILNSLLQILNEGTFQNGDMEIDVPLKLVVAASNEYPTTTGSSNLAAIYDRFLLRKEVTEVRHSRGIQHILFNDIQLTVDENDQLTTAELELLQEGCRSMPWEKSAQDQMKGAVLDCQKKGITPSARRIRSATKACAAMALLSGKASVTANDLGVLRHILWSDPEHRNACSDIVADLCDPADKMRREIEKAFDVAKRNYAEALKGSDDEDANGTAAYGKFAGTLKDLLMQATQAGLTELAQKIREANDEAHEAIIENIRKVASGE